MSRIIFNLIFLAAWFWLPGLWVVILAIVGALFFAWYFEGLVAVLFLELFLGTMTVGGWELPALFGTVAVAGSFLIGDLVRERLIIYND
ncbi:MAG: hypothetical protein A2589_01390 [Candidatus Vogelbacteria bacterium RIFOXYD1_FULL_46_19]|uniref:Uncharacterized protein n=1 Tax=Candidatus Vogelbacteria bacterium RIFOXYD1_FULL_46_19 TaxID=1802439 RepID=A0A1G2QGH4_9BACT|nr:MAG: hypothetical protein A2589_01390 [Candidatus Vogelbacteria bacterium RIFOXYD1_FULL_46_19]